MVGDRTMRATGICHTCQGPYRDAVVASTGAPIRLDPQVDTDGYIWVTGIVGGMLNVQVGGTAKDVPPTEPLRYRAHVCHLTFT